MNLVVFVVLAAASHTHVVLGTRTRTRTMHTYNAHSHTFAFTANAHMENNAKPNQSHFTLAQPRSPLHMSDAGDDSADLSQAMQSDDVDGVRALLTARPACVSATDAAGDTPLHIAALFGSARALAAAGAVLPPADVQAAVNTPNNLGWTPLHYACLQDCPTAAAVLLCLAANPAATNARGQTALDLRRNGDGLGAWTWLFDRVSGSEALQAAVLRRVLQYVRPPDAATPYLKSPSPLHDAVEKDDVFAVSSMLQDMRTGLSDRRVTDTNSLGLTPLAWAATFGSCRSAALLVDAGADPNCRSAQGDTPLHAATKAGQSAAFVVLLAFGADPRSQNRAVRDCVPLCGGGCIEVVAHVFWSRRTPGLWTRATKKGTRSSGKRCSSPWLLQKCGLVWRQSCSKPQACPCRNWTAVTRSRRVTKRWTKTTVTTTTTRMRSQRCQAKPPTSSPWYASALRSKLARWKARHGR